MTVSLLPTRTSNTPRATIGLDLTGLGVSTSATGLSADLPVEKCDLAKLASYTRAAHHSGVDFVSLGEQFRLRSDRAVRRDDWLDPVVAARRISPHAGSAGLIPSVPAGRADLGVVAGELAQVSREHGTWTGLQLAGGGENLARSLPGVSRSIAGARTRSPRPSVVLQVSGEQDVALAGAHADIVRIREEDLGWARELRYAVRAAARAAGREDDVRVLVDLHAVVSQDRASAEERAGLIADIDGDQASWAGALRAYGTVTDVADVVETWVSAGAADGFVVLPGSVPADVAALLKGVVPELRARGLVEEHTVASRPTPRRPDDVRRAAGGHGTRNGSVRTTAASRVHGPASRLAAVPVA
ncbi:alkanesulfonate monooxygenase SsuD/methylene tetrahydromethanopterin reductase-like flavin-dependent oxidoreductase (luciferase family) [Georgenia soli]|uniref:Alkanesulfonate monooxygenase SsuD/methylene tetrahydromethanopterin reductase-like flavin-dependent oxidoreductase (Luciferase family) n=1 Tax=Georgenia soli TaxID=638953 RepID=A0A2A9EQS8_9MICO|nr:LLM class flavin-dependent oxidoreductase [Georgenia soli]PFG40881.1 alkanesulfonate monooxygenase SsuD/methylene tetrahydromethanopterin reductase-like flavin-dependent oxidoreductase (luciferase family) [Georgenia soli]